LLWPANPSLPSPKNNKHYSWWLLHLTHSIQQQREQKRGNWAFRLDWVPTQNR
jgi:hypothetical protein